ncbi:hypothetical protein G4B88_019853 [Cannabis sativa]|uniref:Uncharacterized protein n=1 Tax=Cannabis sativa TaxID=3483 RepID=A0A7J6HS64_CANSA|nr:hypothetical protein G4B88_019853 [Cannabis sativa]
MAVEEAGKRLRPTTEKSLHEKPQTIIMMTTTNKVIIQREHKCIMTKLIMIVYLLHVNKLRIIRQATTHTIDQVGFPNLQLQVHKFLAFLSFSPLLLVLLAKLMDDPTFALPFWNWDSPPGMECRRFIRKSILASLRHAPGPFSTSHLHYWYV